MLKNPMSTNNLVILRHGKLLLWGIIHLSASSEFAKSITRCLRAENVLLHFICFKNLLQILN